MPRYCHVPLGVGCAADAIFVIVSPKKKSHGKERVKDDEQANRGRGCLVEVVRPACHLLEQAAKPTKTDRYDHLHHSKTTMIAAEMQ